MRYVALFPLVVLGLIWNVEGVAAQQQVVVTPDSVSMWQADDIQADDIIDELSRLYELGMWKELQDSLASLLESAELVAPDDWTRHYYVVAFPTTGFRHVAVVILRFPLPEPYTDVLPGLTPSDSLYEVLLIPKHTADGKSKYTFSSYPDPVEAQISSAVEKVVPSLVGILKIDSAPPTLHVRVSRIGIPFKRATILAQYEFKRRKYRVKSGTLVTEKVVEEIIDTLVTTTTVTTTGVVPIPAPKFDVVTTTVTTTSYKVRAPADTLKTTVKKTVTTTNLPILTEALTVKTTLQNSPKRKWDFGLLTGAVLASSGGTPVKVEGGLLVPDPLDGILTMVVVNWYPRPYQPLAQNKSWFPRFRFSAGVVLTPEPGAGAAFGIGLLQGVSLNVGAAFLAVNTTDDLVGTVPSDPNKPFTTSFQPILFAAAGFAFK